MTPIREEAHAAAMKSAIVRVVRPPPNSMLIGEVRGAARSGEAGFLGQGRGRRLGMSHWPLGG